MSKFRWNGFLPAVICAALLFAAGFTVLPYAGNGDGPAAGTCLTKQF